MEIYAAMIERVDMQIDNTRIVFLSDNGPDAPVSRAGFGGGADNRFENLGRPGSFAYLGPGWADAGSAQYYLSKSYATEAGIRVPAVGSGGVVNTTSRSNDSLILVVLTMLELAGAASDSHVDRGGRLPITPQFVVATGAALGRRQRDLSRRETG